MRLLVEFLAARFAADAPWSLRADEVRSGVPPS